MNASFQRSALTLATLAAAGSAIVTLPERTASALSVLPAAPRRRLPLGFVRFAPPTADGMKHPARRGALNPPVVRSRKGRLLAQLAAR